MSDEQHDAIAKLLGIASPPLLTPSDPLAYPEGARGLAAILESRNGFYAFESALHVFPTGESASMTTINAWNEPDGWRSLYGDRLDDHVFFAEDAFGGQFSIANDKVYAFDPETCQLTSIAADIEGWAKAILRDHRLMTGWPLGHDWQAAHGRLEDGHRLVPVIPFVLGGAYNIENLVAMSSDEAMRIYAETWRQTRDLPYGARLRVHLADVHSGETGDS